MPPHKEKLGDLCVRERLITQAQLNLALHHQKRQAAPLHLGDILVEQGFLTREKLRKLAETYGHRDLLGGILVYQGAITQEQLDEALSQQKKLRLRLGQVLLKLQLIDEEKLARALARQMDIACVMPTPEGVNIEVFRRLPPELIKEKCAVPVAESGGVVTVWVADPTDTGLKTLLAGRLKQNVELVVAPRSSLEALVDELLLRERFRVKAMGGEADTERREAPAEKLVINSRDMTSQDPSSASAIFDYLIWDALKQRASDIHIEPARDRLRVRYRVDGVMSTQGDFPLSLGAFMAKRAGVLARLQSDSLDEQREGLIQAEVNHERVDIRLAISQTALGSAITMRLCPERSSQLALGVLGMTPAALAAYEQAAERSSGLTLIAGPKGCGKTTTLYATIRRLNDGTRKIVTLESPIAFLMDGVVQNNIPASRCSAMGKNMANLLSLDPDVTGVGEQGTACALGEVLRYAGMGHRTFAAIHADDSAAALLRIAQEQEFLSLVASCQITIVAQRLVRRICENCSRVTMPSKEVLRAFPVMESMPDSVRFRQGSGCPACRGTGYMGRTGVFEFLSIGPKIREALAGKPTIQEVRALARKEGPFLSLKETGFLKACQGITTLDEVCRALPALEIAADAQETETFQDLCRKAGVQLDGDMART